MRSAKLRALVGVLAVLVCAVAHAEDEGEPTAAATAAAPPEGGIAEPAAPAAEAAEPAAPAQEASAPAAPAPDPGAPDTGPAPAAAEAMAADAVPSADDALAAEAAMAGAEPMAANAPPAAGDDALAGDASPMAANAPPADGDASLPADAAQPSGEAAPAAPALGPVGYDSQGREGRIHTVVGGDTLWDISEAYLGTPWVWPSIWSDNRNIENPHLIFPGDRIWITDSEMRVISAEEAEALLSGTPAGEELPAAPEEPLELAEEPAMPAAPAAPAPDRTALVANRDAIGLVAVDAFDSAASVVDAPVDRVMLSQGDRVFVGLGAGDVEAGDEFTIFRERERVYDPDTGRLLGYHVDILGWLEITDVRDESSVARIRRSSSEIERGDRIVPRDPLPDEVAILPSPNGVEGKVSFFASSRTLTGMSDFVYLNRGTLDGVEVGAPLEVYRPGEVAAERARGARVKLPDVVLAHLLVVKADASASVAFVTEANHEIELGDRFRGATE